MVMYVCMCICVFITSMKSTCNFISFSKELLCLGIVQPLSRNTAFPILHYLTFCNLNASFTKLVTIRGPGARRINFFKFMFLTKVSLLSVGCCKCIVSFNPSLNWFYHSPCIEKENWAQRGYLTLPRSHSRNGQIYSGLSDDKIKLFTNYWSFNETELGLVLAAEACSPTNHGR